VQLLPRSALVARSRQAARLALLAVPPAADRRRALACSPFPNQPQQRRKVVTRKPLSREDHWIITRALAQYDELLDPIPNIVGPAHGAAMCDMALNVADKLWYLRFGIADYAKIEVENVDCVTLQARQVRRESQIARAALRERAGETPVEVREQSRRLGPPLSVREHFVLGADLKGLVRYLAELHCTLANAYGPSHKIVGCVKRVQRALFSLRSRLDSIVCRDFSAGLGPREPPTAAYFGAPAKPATHLNPTQGELTHA
jgi:hypothetical protein